MTHQPQRDDGQLWGQVLQEIGSRLQHQQHTPPAYHLFGPPAPQLSGPPAPHLFGSPASHLFGSTQFPGFFSDASQPTIHSEQKKAAVLLAQTIRKHVAPNLRDKDFDKWFLNNIGKVDLVSTLNRTIPLTFKCPKESSLSTDICCNDLPPKDLKNTDKTKLRQLEQCEQVGSAFRRGKVVRLKRNPITTTSETYIEVPLERVLVNSGERAIDASNDAVAIPLRPSKRPEGSEERWYALLRPARSQGTESRPTQLADNLLQVLELKSTEEHRKKYTGLPNLIADLRRLKSNTFDVIWEGIGLVKTLPLQQKNTKATYARVTQSLVVELREGAKQSLLLGKQTNLDLNYDFVLATKPQLKNEWEASAFGIYANLMRTDCKGTGRTFTPSNPTIRPLMDTIFGKWSWVQTTPFEQLDADRNIHLSKGNPSPWTLLFGCTEPFLIKVGSCHNPTADVAYIYVYREDDVDSKILVYKCTRAAPCTTPTAVGRRWMLEMCPPRAHSGSTAVKTETFPFGLLLLEFLEMARPIGHTLLELMKQAYETSEKWPTDGSIPDAAMVKLAKERVASSIRSATKV